MGFIMHKSVIFDETKIDWNPLPDPDGNPADYISMSILNLDDEAKIADVLFKFAAEAKILKHRHTCHYSTFTVKGELRIFDAQEKLIEIRPAGTFKWGAPGEVHTEGGGKEDVVALFSLRPYSASAPIYEILDDNFEVAATVTFEDLKALDAEYAVQSS